MTATPSLDLRNADGSRLSFMRPMLGVESWRALTGFSEDDLLAEIESGKVRFAFNLSRRSNAKADRRLYLRVWNRSIICFLNPDLNQPRFDDLASALNYILPHKRDALRCSDLARAFNVSRSHIINLVEDKLVDRIPGQSLAACETPTVTRASVVRFLTERRIQ